MTMPTIDEPLDLEATDDDEKGLECIPCMELLRRIDEDLEEYDKLIAARRQQRRQLYLSGGIGVVVGTAIAFAIYFLFLS